MRTIMARTPHESSFSFSRRYFNWRKKPEDHLQNGADYDYSDQEALTSFDSSSLSFSSLPPETTISSSQELEPPELEPRSCVTTIVPKKKLSVSKFRSIFTKSSKPQSLSSPALGSKAVGTLFGYRRGHVHIAFQEDPKSPPAFLIELSTLTSVLVREMASGLVRVALECDKKFEKVKGVRLLEEPLWRAYCNGKKCGYAMKKDCGAHEWRVLRAVGPITMGAGVLPSEGGEVGPEGELMYMRAKFERVVGSKDSEAFYMMNPDGSGGPELSVYLLRV